MAGPVILSIEELSVTVLLPTAFSMLPAAVRFCTAVTLPLSLNLFREFYIFYSYTGPLFFPACVPAFLEVEVASTAFCSLMDYCRVFPLLAITTLVGTFVFLPAVTDGVTGVVVPNVLLLVYICFPNIC